MGAEALAAAFTAHGYETDFALSGLEAVDRLYRFLADVIILDINMPHYNGFDTARIIRMLDSSRDTPIIAFTALAASAVLQKAQEVGMDAYCQKGAAITHLFALVDEFVQ